MGLESKSTHKKPTNGHNSRGGDNTKPFRREKKMKTVTYNLMDKVSIALADQDESELFVDNLFEMTNCLSSLMKSEVFSDQLGKKTFEALFREERLSDSVIANVVREHGGADFDDLAGNMAEQTSMIWPSSLLRRWA
jgi:hypothetical protein